jgi:putative transposase
MKRSRFSEEQIIAVLKEHEAGFKTADRCRKHGISEQTFYNWNSKYGGLEVSEARRLRALEDENRKLKKLLAETMLDNAMLKDLNAKNGDARCEAAGCDSSLCCVRGEPAAGESRKREGGVEVPIEKYDLGRKRDRSCTTILKPSRPFRTRVHGSQTRSAYRR